MRVGDRGESPRRPALPRSLGPAGARGDRQRAPRARMRVRPCPRSARSAQPAVPVPTGALGGGPRCLQDRAPPRTPAHPGPCSPQLIPTLGDSATHFCARSAPRLVPAPGRPQLPCLSEGPRLVAPSLWASVSSWGQLTVKWGRGKALLRVRVPAASGAQASLEGPGCPTFRGEQSAEPRRDLHPLSMRITEHSGWGAPRGGLCVLALPLRGSPRPT